MVLVMFGVLCTGCQTINSGLNKAGYQKIDEANAKIEQVQQNAIKKQDELTAQINAERQKVIDVQQKQKQEAADELFAANYAFSLIPLPNRSDIVINYRVRTAFNYLQMPPSWNKIQATMDQIKADLDEALTKVSDLQKRYEAEKVKAEALQAEKVKAEDTIKVVQEEKVKVEAAKNEEIAAIQRAKDAETKKLLDEQQRQLNDSKERAALIRKLMYFSGAGFIIFLAAAVYAPVYKRESAIIAAILGAVTISLPFLEFWMIGLGAGLVVSGLIIWMIYKHQSTLKKKDAELKQEKTVSGNLVNAFQDIKEKSKEVFDNIAKPALEEWNTKYVKDKDGNVTVVPDESVIKAIDQKLVDSQRK